MRRNVRKLIITLAMVTILIVGLAMTTSALNLGTVKTITAADVTSEEITIKWSSVNSVRGYVVYRYDYSAHAWSRLGATHDEVYTDKDVEPGSLYAYRLKTYQVSNGEYYFGDYSKFTNVMSDPYKTTGLKATKVTTNSVTLNWNATKGADAYIVYRLIDGKYKSLGLTTKTTYNVSNLPDDTKYDFRVRAYSKSYSYYGYGSPSDAYYVKTDAVKAPAKVINLSAKSVTPTTITLQWRETNADTTGYVVFIYDAAAKSYKIAGLTKKGTTEFTVKNLAVGTPYYFVVRAYNRIAPNVSYGTCSSVLKVGTVGPIQAESVNNLRASSVGYTDVKLSWDKVKTDATGYIVYKYNTDKSSYERIGYTKADVTTFNVTGLKQSTQYQFVVKAYHTVSGKTAYGAWNSESALKLDTKTVPTPNTVSNVKAVSAQNSITLTWNETQDTYGYIIYMYNKQANTYERYGYTRAGTTTMEVTDLDDTTQYIFKVRAYNYVDPYKTYGDPSDALVSNTSLDSVKNFKTKVASTTDFEFSWSPVELAEAYVIEKYSSDTKVWNEVETTSSTTYYSGYYENGMSANFRIRPYLIDKNNSKVFGEYTYLRGTTIPSMPTNLQFATNSDNGISIKFDGDPIASGYKVERYNALDGTWQNIGLTAKMSYNDNHLKETKEYKYRVTTYSVSGTKVYYSETCESITVFFKAIEEPTTIYDSIKILERKGLFGYLYAPPADGNDYYFYTSGDPWQRNFGFNELYDTLAPATLINYDTVRFKFTTDDTDWMFQLWKGQYGLLFYGGEIGIYNKPSARELEHYDCINDDELLNMSLTFYEKEGLFMRKWVEKFSRPYGSYWWCTGFIPGNTGLIFSDLRIDARITMRDYEMLAGFTDALEEQNFEYEVKGLDVYFTYI